MPQFPPLGEKLDSTGVFEPEHELPRRLKGSTLPGVSPGILSGWDFSLSELDL